MTQPAEGLSGALSRAGKAVKAAREQRLRPLDLSLAHYTLLTAIEFNSGASGAAIARQLHVTPQNVAGLVPRLERRGLIRRRPHPVHQYVLEMRITPEGEELLRAADTAMIRLDQEIGELIGEEQADQLRGLLDSLSAAIRDPDPQVRARDAAPQPAGTEARD